jgi:hypothetical protein
MSKTPPLDSIPKSGQQSPQSRAAPAVPAKLLPAAQPAIAGKAEPWLRKLWPRLAPEPLPGADPGLAIMQAVDLIAADMRSLIPSDLQLRRMFQRYGHLLAEGNGVMAAEDLRSIDHYVSGLTFEYARLRRKELRALRVQISKAAAFCVVTFPAGKPPLVHINFSLTGRGHEARGAVVIESRSP